MNIICIFNHNNIIRNNNCDCDSALIVLLNEEDASIVAFDQSIIYNSGDVVNIIKNQLKQWQ